MTPAEYVQLKAFARQDGALMALLWVSSFACYILGISNPMYTLAALTLMIATPFYAARRLRRFRDEDRGGLISFGRGWAYVVYIFFYASVLLALVQYLYFAYMDQGYLLSSFTSALSSPEGKQVLEQYGMQQTAQESLEAMSKMRPIDYALNVLTMNIMTGMVLGVPIAALTKTTAAAERK